MIYIKVTIFGIHLANLCSLTHKKDELLLLCQTNKDFLNFTTHHTSFSVRICAFTPGLI